MKILNLFAGIGGNRTLWGDKHEITAVEHDQRIAMIYLKRFPNDKVIVGDAYEYLEVYFREFDVIWCSPPCTSHTCLLPPNIAQGCKGKLPDLRLYSLVIFLKSYFKGYYVIENVVPYYKPLITPTNKIGRHFFWSNITLQKKDGFKQFFKHGGGTKDTSLEDLCNFHKVDYDEFKNISNIKQYLRNCVDPEVGRYILDSIENKKQLSMEEFLK